MSMKFNGKNKKRGQMLVLAAASVAALIALAGFGIDMSNVILKHYQLQRALDSAVLNDVLYNELNINRQMRRMDATQKAVSFLENATVANMKMMGIDITVNDLTMDGSDAAHKTGIRVFINGVDVKDLEAEDGEGGNEEEDEDCGGCNIGCDNNPIPSDDPILQNVSSIRVCVTAQLNVKTTLMGFVGIQKVPLIVTSCSRRIIAAITMVLDISDSMRGVPFDNLCSASKDFIDQFQEGIDMMSIVTFGTHAKVWQGLERIANIHYAGSEGKAALKAIVDQIHAAGTSGDTNLPEAIIVAREELKKAPGPANGEPGAYKTMVIFSDGAPTAMTVDFANPSTVTPSHLRTPLVELTLPLNSWNASSASIDLPARTPQWQSLSPNSNTGFSSISIGRSSGTKYVYTYKGSYYWYGFNLFNPATVVPTDTIQYRDTNVPCSSDLSVNWLWGDTRLYNDPLDCLDTMNFYDSKGNFQNMDPVLNNSYGDGMRMNRPSPYYSTTPYALSPFHSGGSSGSTMKNLTLPYLEAIVEADYAMAEGVTLYAVGLAQSHLACGGTSNPYVPCCGPGSNGGVVGGPPVACETPIPGGGTTSVPCPGCVTQQVTR